ncbi:MAG: stage IV sporulation protein A, partial [Clostridia bacterium]|nr:stage IV sporulation protein A [Clostridia bacterium]
DGRTIMTTQPKFVPANSVKIQFKNKSTANLRLVDCVGYIIDGATGHLDEDKPRLVKTPWSEKEMPFEQAAEIGTKKVIDEYSTIGIVVTTDGSIGDIPRKSYVPAEERVVNELKVLNKPFVIVLNCVNPEEQKTLQLATELEEKYGVSVICCNVLNMGIEKIDEIMEKVLLEFPMLSVNVQLPRWMQALTPENPVIKEIIEGVKSSSECISKMGDFGCIQRAFENTDFVDGVELNELRLGCGCSDYNIRVKDDLFYKILSEECGEEIEDDCALMSYVKGFSECKNKYAKIKDALSNAEENGYGVVLPTLDELVLEKPTLVKQGGRYGVKLSAKAPSLHIIRVDVSAEISPTVGSEKQGQDMVDYISTKYEENPSGIWSTDMFGKSLHDMVDENLSDKVKGIPEDTQKKVRKTLTRMVNENKGGLICIIL